MLVPFGKFHALENDFIVIDSLKRRMTSAMKRRIVRAICHRRNGVGADGVLFIQRSKVADAAVDIYNSDGSWAEKSGNGLRIAALYLKKSRPARKRFCIETATSVDTVRIGVKTSNGWRLTAELGTPDFAPSSLPVRTRKRILLNSPIKLGPVRIPVTCLSVGNPHTVIVVDDFDFDWRQIGRDCDKSPLFPHGTNVEFVHMANRRKLIVADWERGAGATGSSGTGAAAAVCAMVMLGLAERRCRVQFESGSIEVFWRPADNVVEISGAVTEVCKGTFILK